MFLANAHTSGFRAALDMSVCLLVALLAITSVTNANLALSRPKPRPVFIYDVVREVTFHLDDDLFIEQVSFMRSHVNSMEAKEGNFTAEEVLVKEQEMTFKLFDFDLMNRLFEKTSTNNYVHDSQGELNVKVHRLGDLVVLMLQPIAFWIRMPLQRSLGSKAVVCEKINAEFKLDIDLFKLQKFLRSNQWYSETVSQKMDDSNRCVKHQLNRVFQLKSIFHRYLNHTDDLGYDFGDKFDELMEAINENCMEMHVDALKEVLKPIVVDDFDFNQIYTKEELERQKKVNEEKEAEAKRVHEKAEEEHQQQEKAENHSTNVHKQVSSDKEEPEEESVNASRLLPSSLSLNQSDNRSDSTPSRRWRVDTKTRYEMTETEGSLVKKHLEGSIDESRNGIII